MKRYFHSSVTALAMTAMVMSGVVVATFSLSAAPAFSKSDNANSNSNSGRENSNRGGNRGNRSGATSSLGALNAAHANANALANAAENSRVGMIAIYKTAVGLTADAKDALALFIAECGAEDSEPEAYCTQFLADAALVEGVDDFTVESYIIFLEEKIESAETFENGALEAAANKVTDDQIIQALWDLLEIDGYELAVPVN